MAAFLITLIAVGLAPVRLRLELRVTPEGRVRALAAWGVLSKEFDIGDGALGIKWLADLIRGIDDPRPFMALPALARMNLDARRVSVRCRLGVADAAQTAMLSGAVSILLRALCGWFASWSAGGRGATEPEVVVTPVFNHPVFELIAAVELRARLGKFANLGARFAARLLSRGINRRKPTQIIKRAQTA
ncbi:MAG: DUF2953 domain-containing protein [Oscillospiraceae bacterium]|jgi:hypothetical protein|nr:DUF2953 domain-containing protein [Oscillospiraceae bacterium]